MLQLKKYWLVNASPKKQKELINYNDLWLLIYLIFWNLNVQEILNSFTYFQEKSPKLFIKTFHQTINMHYQ